MAQRQGEESDQLKVFQQIYSLCASADSRQQRTSGGRQLKPREKGLGEVA